MPRLGPDLYQSSKPGATTPMAGISRGPARKGKSSAGVGSAPVDAAATRLASAVGSTVVWEMARSDATVSAVAPAPSTEAAGTDRRRALGLLMNPVSLPERQRTIVGGDGTR